MSSIFEYFAASAVRNPSRPAIFADGRLWSYGELCSAAEKVVAALGSLGIRETGRMIALAAGRTFGTFAGLLGIVASGNAYVPLNLRWPDARILEVCRCAAVSGLIFDPIVAVKLAGIFSKDRNCSRAVDVELSDSSEVRFLQMPTHEARQSPVSPVHAGCEAAPYVYLIFTSGSTGVPKGVPVTQENVKTCLEGTSLRYPIEKEDRCVMMADLSFDVSVAEMFLCWKAGACLYVPNMAQMISPSSFIRNNQLSVWSSVPSAIRSLRDLGNLKGGSLPSLRLAMFCGEALPSRWAEQWQQAAKSSSIVNLYGPTEATIFATSCVWDPSMATDSVVPIGKNLPGISCMIDWSDGKHIEGELLLSGPQVVCGYWNDPAATSRAFVENENGELWYRTGDLVEVDQTHGFRFLGRLDSQVKCRGFRVDTNEVARAVAKVTSSDLVVVIPVTDDDGLCVSLVAFCDTLMTDELSARLSCAKELPDYMLPRRIVHLHKFPLTANGKVDRPLLAFRAREVAYGGERN
jgi:amino acid adenylation domain-containing protein